MKKKKKMTAEQDKKSGYLNRVHNNVFVKTFSDPENVKVFLKMALPEGVLKSIDFSDIKIDDTTYVADDVKDHYSDLVVKLGLLSQNEKKQDEKTIPADIYFLMEHKSSFHKKKALVQVLKYMYLEWQKDSDQKKPLRIIIPLFFYHGKEKWTVPRTFADQFDVNEEIKNYVLNYRYILFDTRDWDFLAAGNEELKDNVFLLTSLMLMKSAFNDDMESVDAIFRLWNEKGFTNERNKVLFLLTYLTEIRDFPLEQLKKKLEESNIDGGDIMASLAQRLRDEGEEKGMQKGIQKANRLTAKKLAKSGVDIELISSATGLPREEIEKFAPKAH